MVKVLNFCDLNIARYGRGGYKHYLNDPRVVVDQPPKCLNRCYECSQSAIALMGEIVDPTNVSLDIWVLLQGKTPTDLIKSIEEKLNE